MPVNEIGWSHRRQHQGNKNDVVYRAHSRLQKGHIGGFIYLISNAMYCEGHGKIFKFFFTGCIFRCWGTQSGSKDSGVETFYQVGKLDGISCKPCLELTLWYNNYLHICKEVGNKEGLMTRSAKFFIQEMPFLSITGY